MGVIPIYKTGGLRFTDYANNWSSLKCLKHWPHGAGTTLGRIMCQICGGRNRPWGGRRLNGGKLRPLNIVNRSEKILRNW